MSIIGQQIAVSKRRGMTPEELAELKALEQAATPGPWTAEYVSDDFEVEKEYCVDEEGEETECKEDGYCFGHFDYHLYNVVGPTYQQHDDYVFLGKSDAELIAAMRNRLPGLLELVASLQVEFTTANYLKGKDIKRKRQIARLQYQVRALEADIAQCRDNYDGNHA